MRRLRVWIVQVGEPLPIDREGLRLWRSGMIAEMMRDRGHEVVWWASNFRHSDHTFRFERETRIEWNGITLALMHSPGYRKNVSVRRLWDHHVLGKNLATAVSNLAAPHVIHCGYPTLETCEAMVHFGVARKVPTVIDIRDMWPEAFRDVLPRWGVPIATPFLKYFDRRVARMLRQASAIHAHAPRFLDYGLKKAGRKPTAMDRCFPFAYRSSPPSVSELRDAESYWDQQGVRRENSKLTICFFGNMNTERLEEDYRTLAEAVRIARQRGVSVRAVYCGEGAVVDRFRVEFGDIGDCILLPGYANAARIWVLMRRSDMGLLPYPPTQDFVDSIPNKAVEYLSGSLPILTSLTRGHLFERLSAADCVVTYPGRDPAELSEILEKFSADPTTCRRLSENARRLFEQDFRSERVYRELTESLEAMAR